MGRKARIRAERRALAQQRGRAEALLLPLEVREQYSSALAMLFERVATQPPSADPANAWLKTLASFYQDHVRWAVLKPDGHVESLEGGARVLGWFVAISPDHPRARQQRRVLQTDWLNSHYGLFVRPERVTHEWAALLAIHEIEHIASMVSGRESRSQGREPYLAGEVRAYSVEGAAADVLSGGRYLASVRRRSTMAGSSRAS